MITGFNSDIEFNGTVYHVQTEDKGVDSPLILTLVYVGGAILASKRVLYDDLLEEGFNEAALTERLSRQHKLICAAVRSGRIDELKEMSRRDAAVRAAQTIRPGVVPVEAALPADIETNDEPNEPEPVVDFEPVTESTTEPAAQEFPIFDSPVFEAEPLVDVALMEDALQDVQPEPEPSITFSEPLVPVSLETQPLTPPEPESRPRLTSAEDTGYAGMFDKVNLTGDEFPSDRPSLELIDEATYKAGEAVTLNIALRGALDEGSKGLAHAPVGVKILGTNFRPIILSSKTDREGIASVTVMLPHFTSGRAAILIRAVVSGQTVELRRMIHHG